MPLIINIPVYALFLFFKIFILNEKLPSESVELDLKILTFLECVGVLWLLDVGWAEEFEDVGLTGLLSGIEPVSAIVGRSKLPDRSKIKLSENPVFFINFWAAKCAKAQVSSPGLTIISSNNKFYISGENFWVDFKTTLTIDFKNDLAFAYSSSMSLTPMNNSAKNFKFFF